MAIQRGGFPSVVDQAIPEPPDAAQTGSYTHRSEYWRRRESTKRITLDQGQDLSDVVDIVDQQLSGIEGLRPEGFLAFWRRSDIAKPEAKHVVDKLLQSDIPLAPQTGELGGDVIIDRQGCPHASKHR